MGQSVPTPVKLANIALTRKRSRVTDAAGNGDKGEKVEDEPTVDEQLSDALKQLQSAIALLDRSNAPAHIAAHVDLAVHQLQDAMESRATGGSLSQMDTNAEPH